MKNLISIFILIIILFFSCTAKKNSLHTNLEQKTTQQNSISDTKTGQLEGKKTVVDQSKNNIGTVTKTTLYDTDKPINKETGKPPIKAEIITTQTTAQENDVKTDIDLNKKDESTHKEESKATEQAKEESKAVEKSKPMDGKYLFYIIVAVGILIVGFLIYWNFAKIKKFLGWVS
ncbi:MAG: hypothetical protein M1292_11520 [Bacteroidetes bacterium]|nr:hypothetical protein [Bacteroidota bacterium]